MSNVNTPRFARTFRRLASVAALLAAFGAVACSQDSGDAPADAPDAAVAGVECVTDADCAEGVSCDENGACTINDLLGESWENECAVLDATFVPVTPTVVLLIDQSGSMSASYAGGSRWSVLQDALMDGTDGVVSGLQSDVQFGMAMYTSHAGFSGGTCPMLADVDVALDNYTAMDAVYSAAQPDGDTPTGEALTAVSDKLAALANVEGPRAIILATDGEPDTCADPNPTTAAGLDAARDVSIAAAQHAFDSGIRTYVLAVGNEVGESHLQDMANAGAGLAVDGGDQATFYRPDDKQGLIDAFNHIIDAERPCLFAIESTQSIRGEFDPALAQFSTVTLDGAPLTYGDADGWRMVGDDHIEILGAACQTLKSGGEHELSGTFVCEAPPGVTY